MIEDYDSTLCRKMAGKPLIEMFMLVGFDSSMSISENKNETLEWVNSELDTNYNVNHLNNWLADRKPTPRRVQSMMRKAVLQYLFSDDIAEMIAGLC